MRSWGATKTKFSLTAWDCSAKRLLPLPGCFQLDGSSCAQCSPALWKLPAKGVARPVWTLQAGRTWTARTASKQSVVTPRTMVSLPNKLAAGAVVDSGPPRLHLLCCADGTLCNLDHWFPVPRTAIHYTINEDCKLLEHGLAIDGDTCPCGAVMTVCFALKLIAGSVLLFR